LRFETTAAFILPENLDLFIRGKCNRHLRPTEFTTKAKINIVIEGQQDEGIRGQAIMIDNWSSHWQLSNFMCNLKIRIYQFLLKEIQN
jgi:hypothetical protein